MSKLMQGSTSRRSPNRKLWTTVKRPLKTAVTALVVTVSVALSATAGLFEDAIAAIHRGDYAIGLQLYRQAADQGDTRAQIQLAVRYENSSDYAEAARWFRKAAEQGVAYGQYSLASHYEQGHGVRQDYAEAVKWYRKAVEQGYDLAEPKLGLMYYDGRGVAQDYAEAARWFRKAAEAGDVTGQYYLGLMYYNGQGVPQDYVWAHMWFNLSASRIVVSDKSERDEIVQKRDMVAVRMTPAQIAEAQKLAREWKPK